MKYFVVSLAICLGAIFGSAHANPGTLSISIDNASNRVSPGGELRFSVVGTATEHSYIGIPISVSDTSVLDPNAPNWISWNGSSSDPSTHRKYVALPIAKAITSLPKTITLRVGTASATFYIEAGDYGKPLAKFRGKHVIELRINAGSPHWHQFICVSNPTGHCRVDFKNGDHNPFDGKSPINVPRHSCDDMGWTAGSKIDIRDPLIYDLSKLVVKRDGAHSVPVGHVSHDSAICRIISDGPILIEPVSVVPKVQ